MVSTGRVNYPRYYSFNINCSFLYSGRNNISKVLQKEIYESVYLTLLKPLSQNKIY
jgi:hypothetical protein